MTSPYKPGDRVQVITEYWMSAGTPNKMWHPPGTIGTVDFIHSDNTVRVNWDVDTNVNLYIDIECIAPYPGPVTDEEMAEVMRLLGVSE